MTDKITPVPAATPALTHNPSAIAGQLKENIGAMSKDAAILPPLLGYALTNLRGALNAIEGHLKTTVTLLALVLALALPASAQVFSGGLTIVGSSNAPVQVNFVPITNTAYSTLPARTLLIQNLVSNSTVNVNYGYQWAGLGGTNLFLANNFTTNFNGAGLTNGSTVIIYLPQLQNMVAIQPWGNYTATNSLGNVTNIVTLQ